MSRGNFRYTPPLPPLSHPDWCALDRCGHLNPPGMPYLARRHLGEWERIGDLRGPGFMVVYLIAADPRWPAIAFNTVSKVRGKGGAELSLPDAARLVRRLNDLLAQAGYELPDGNGDADA